MPRNLVDFLTKVANVDYSSRDSEGESAFSVTNTVGNGKRTSFAPFVIEDIGNPTHVQFAFFEDGVAVRQHVAGEGTKFALRKSGRRSTIYASNLVKAITEMYGLDFSNRTQISFRDYEVTEVDGLPVAFIPIQSANMSEPESPDTENLD